VVKSVQYILYAAQADTPVIHIVKSRKLFSRNIAMRNYMHVVDFKRIILQLLHRFRGAKYCDERFCMSPCISVCPVAYRKNPTSQNFLYVLNVVVVLSSYDDIAIRYV